MTDDLGLNDYLKLVNTEIQIKQCQINDIKPNFFPMIAIIVGFIASSTITTEKSDITAFWFFLGILTIFFLSLNKFLVHRRLFISKNKNVIEEQKQYPIFTRLIRSYYYIPIYFPFLLGFVLIFLFGFFESFLFPLASSQISTVFKDFSPWIMALTLLVFILVEIYRKAIRMFKNKIGDEIVFFDWLTRHSIRLENITFTFGIYSILFFGALIQLTWRDLNVKNFGLELILIIILVGMWSIVIQMLNCSKVINIETKKLNYLNYIKERLLYADFRPDEIAQKFSLIYITKLESEPLFLFFSYYYYSLDRSLLEKLEPDLVEQFF
ncbi:MAG: hypothetical protein WC348_04830 [Patescibacteria group bacterium]|jgi:hypothetical protein